VKQIRRKAKLFKEFLSLMYFKWRSYKIIMCKQFTNSTCLKWKL